MIRRFWLAGLSGLALALGPWSAASAQFQRDSGLSAAYPWSGYWWQHASGGLVPPLQKYDQATGLHAAAWEQSNHVALGANTPSWFGHCHAWSASSVLEREPTAPRQERGVSFGVGDQKGLLAACHAQDIANSYGQRYDEGGTEEAKDDLRPDELWRYLQLYIQRQKLPLILDLEAGPQVWNYPIYQYEVNYQVASDGTCTGVMELLAADNNVVPDYVGTQYTVHRYTFELKFRNGAIVSGSGRWTGPSVEDHPDFGWYPYVAVAENPDVNADEVSKILGYRVAEAHSAPGGDVPPVVDPVRPITPSRPEPPVPPEPPQPLPLGDLLDPYELALLVAGRKSDFMLDVVVDRNDGGKYRPGEPVGVAVRSGEAGYLYLFDVDPSGGLRLVFPKLGEPNRIDAKVLYELPGKGKAPLLVADEPGRHDLKAIVTDRPLKITGVRQIPPGMQQQRQQSKPEPVVVPPTTERQMGQIIVAGLRKGEPVAKPDRQRNFRFAQDASAYYVYPPSKGPKKPRGTER